MAEPVAPTPLRAAFEVPDHEALVEALSPDVVLWSPMPFPAVAAFLSETGPKLADKRGGSGRAAFLKVAGAPVSALMRITAATGPRLLGLRRSRS